MIKLFSTYIPARTLLLATTHWGCTGPIRFMPDAPLDARCVGASWIIQYKPNIANNSQVCRLLP
jgi:hypothetical protein